MIWQDKAFLAGYFMAVILVQCLWQAALFKRNIKISHFKHGIYYTLTVIPAVWMFWPMWWQVPLIAFFERLAFFDIVLNLIRRKHIFYNGGYNPESYIDQFENVFTKFWIDVFKVCYVVAFVIVIVKV